MAQYWKIIWPSGPTGGDPFQRHRQLLLLLPPPSLGCNVRHQRFNRHRPELFFNARSPPPFREMAVVAVCTTSSVDANKLDGARLVCQKWRFQLRPASSDLNIVLFIFLFFKPIKNSSPSVEMMSPRRRNNGFCQCDQMFGRIEMAKMFPKVVQFVAERF